MSEGGVVSGSSRIPLIVSAAIVQDVSTLLTRLVRAMCQVLVHRPWLALGAAHGDTLLGSIVKQVASALEALVEDRFSPRRKNLDGRLEGVVLARVSSCRNLRRSRAYCQLEAD